MLVTASLLLCACTPPDTPATKNKSMVEIIPMPLVNGLSGTFAREKLSETVNVSGKERQIKKSHYYLLIDGTKLEAPMELFEKMFAAADGRKVYSSVFRYEWSPYDFTVSSSGLKAQVLATLDYGNEKFIKCAVGEEVLFVKCDEQVGDIVYLVPDVNKVSVIETARQIRIV